MSPSLPVSLLRSCFSRQVTAAVHVWFIRPLLFLNGCTSQDRQYFPPILRRLMIITPCSALCFFTQQHNFFKAGTRFLSYLSLLLLKHHLYLSTFWLFLAHFWSDMIRLSLLLSNHVAEDLLSRGAEVSWRAFSCCLLGLQYYHYLQSAVSWQDSFKVACLFPEGQLVTSEHQSHKSM